MIPLRNLICWSRSTRIQVAALVVGALVAGAASGARASDDPAAAEAKKHYEEGTKAYNLGEYPRAIAEFKATYNAKPDPLLLYNIAQSYRLAEDAPQALFFYKSFLRNMPAATNRKEVEGRIKELEKKVAEQKKDPGTAPPPVVVPAVPSPGAAPGVAPTTGTAPAPLSSPQSNAASSAASAPPTRGAAANAPVVPLVPTAPPPTTSVDAPESRVDLSAPSSAPDPAGSPYQERPFYKKWWFWAGAAGVLILATGLGVASARKSSPDTELGTYYPEWRP